MTITAVQSSLNTSLAVKTLEDFLYERSRLYHFLGRVYPWTNDSTPPTFSKTQQEITQARNDILYTKLVSPSDISLIIPKYTWTTGTVYLQWDDTIVMSNNDKFYCMNDEYNVYKCLNNNNGAESTYKPTGTSLEPIIGTDGYIWKYMYNVPILKRTKFVSNTFIPVQTALTNRFYNNGGVEEIVIVNGGSGYTNSPETTITVTNSGHTTGSDAILAINEVNGNGAITATGITITNGGSGYTKGTRIVITSSGAGAIIVPVINGSGTITSCTVTNGGSGYSITDEINAIVGNAILRPIVSTDSGSILDVIIEDPGIGYSSAPILTVNHISGTAKYPENVNPKLTAIVSNGILVDVLIEDPGIDLPFDNSTTITVTGDGSNASFTPVVIDGSIVNVLVDNPGQNYSYMQLTVNGDGNGAILSSVYGSYDYRSDQGLVEQTAVDGAIYAIKIINSGTNYTLATTTVTINGDGVNATAIPVIDGNGSIINFIMTSFGYGYTYATVEIVDTNPARPISSINASARVILPPFGGHGSNAIQELFAKDICAFNVLREDKILNALDQSFRQYGILCNPIIVDSHLRYTNSTNILLFTITMNNTSGMNINDILINNGTRYRVIVIDNNIVKLQQLSSIYKVPTLDNIEFYNEDNSLLLYTMSSLDEIPIVNKYSGDLLFVTNEIPFTPNEYQSIAFRSILTF